MSERPYKPGGDAQVISDVAKKHFGDFSKLFEYHGWPERGPDMMRKVQTRVVETYGSVRAFEEYFQRAGFTVPESIWADDTSVLLTSYWGWSPETWGTLGWTGDRGRSRRENLLGELSNPFITVVYVTKGRSDTGPDLKGKIAGFYVMSHETGDRDGFTHPIHHDREPGKWRHSLRATRAFTYLPEYLLDAYDVFPEIRDHVLAVASMGEVVHDLAKIDRLRSTPCVEVPVYAPRMDALEPLSPELPVSGMVPAGPASSGGYEVLEGTQNLPRELYILRLTGDTAAYLGYPVEGVSIYKIGLSASPDLRRQTLQKSMPKGAFFWQVERTTRGDGHAPYSGFSAAVAGEYAMKVHLARNADHLGGEFYLASEDNIATAWEAGRQAALRIDQEGFGHADR